MTKVVIFSCNTWSFEIPQVNILCLALYPILKDYLVLWSLTLGSMDTLDILNISPLSDVRIGKVLFLVTVSFALQKISNFMRSHLPIVDLRA